MIKRKRVPEIDSDKKKMNSESFDIQSIYAMKNVYFICFWSEAANIFVYKIFLRKQINAKGGCKKRRPKQFSVQRRSSGPACAAKSWFYSGRIREAKSLASSFSDERILLIFCHQIWSVRIVFCIERKRRRKNALTLKNSAVSRRFPSELLICVTWNIQILHLNARICAFYFNLRN